MGVYREGGLNILECIGKESHIGVYREGGLDIWECIGKED